MQPTFPLPAATPKSLSKKGDFKSKLNASDLFIFSSNIKFVIDDFEFSLLPTSGLATNIKQQDPLCRILEW